MTDDDLCRVFIVMKRRKALTSRSRRESEIRQRGAVGYRSGYRCWSTFLRGGYGRTGSQIRVMLDG